MAFKKDAFGGGLVGGSRRPIIETISGDATATGYCVKHARQLKMNLQKPDGKNAGLIAMKASYECSY